MSFAADACQAPCDRYALESLSLTAPGSVTGSTTGAAHVTGSAAGEVGVDITIPHAGEWNFDLCFAGSTFAADLYLYTASPCAGGSLMLSATTNSCAGSSAARLLSVGLQAGTYHLMVGNAALLEGAFELGVSEVSPARATSGGPDGYGYLWVNSLDAAGPEFNWVEISSVGTPVNFASGASTVGPIALGMDFPFYDSVYNQCYLSSDGFLSFEALANSYPGNAAIPAVALPNALIAAFWDDLSLTAGVSQAYTWWDAAGQRFIVQFDRFTKTSEPITFQLILEADGDVLLHYLRMPELLLNSASVGLEDTGGTRGLRASLNNVGSALYEGVAIRCIRPTDMQGPEIVHTPLPDTPMPGPWSVQAQLSDASGVASANLSYRVEAGAWTVVAMSSAGGGLWSATIPNAHGSLDYFITATDGANPARSRTSHTWTFVARPTSGGPDSYGYRWRSSREPGGPQFLWEDISSVGTALAIANNSKVTAVPLGMTFPFYGTSYSQITVSSEGFLTFGTYSDFGSINSPLPSMALPHAIIAGFWDDLGMTVGTSQLYHFVDTVGQRCIFQYQAFTKGTTPLTFQIILQANGDILVNYLDLPDGLVNSATVGLENSTGTVGLQANYTNTGAGLFDATTLLFSLPTDVEGPVIGHTPMTDTESFGPWPLTVSCTDASGVAGVTLNWRSDAGAWQTVPFSPSGGDQWAGELPATSGQIQYYFTAVDTYTPAHSTTSPTWTFLRRHTRGGPDSFGHIWVNSRDPEGPAFQWEDIRSVGTPLSLSMPYSNPLSLPFPFPFFDQLKSALRVNVHGSLEFAASNYGNSLLGQSPPNSAVPNDLIAVFWGGINARPSGSGQVWTWHDVAGQRFLVQWLGHMVAGGAEVEVQAVLEPTGRIEIRLLQVDESLLTGATLGMENATGTDGFAMHRYGNGSLLADSLSFVMAAPGPEIQHTPLADTLLPGPYLVQAQISDPSGVASVTLDFRVDEGAWQSLPMQGTPPLWTASIPDAWGVVDYRIQALNTAQLGTTSPTWRFGHRRTRSAEVDSCGYSWVSSVDPQGPAFNWVDISALTTPFQVSGGFQSPPMAIGFDFPFYEGLEDSFRVCGNGMIHFSAWAWELSGVHPIPSTAGADGIVAPFWDLLSPTSAGYPGSIWVLSQPALGRCIVQFHTVAQGGSVYLDFQVILYASGDILFQYLNVDEADVSQATVGVEDINGLRGLQLNYRDIGCALQDNLAILLPFTDRLAPVVTHDGVPDVGVGETVDITVGLVDYATGVAAAELRYQLNGGAEQTVPLVPGLDPLYHATLPDMGAPGLVSYRVVAWDGATPPNERVSGVWTYEVFAFTACQTPGPANALPYAFAYPTDEGFGSVVAERFGGLNGPIASLDFQGNTMAQNPSTGLWSMCESGGLTALVRVLFLDLNLQPVAEVVDTLAGSLSPEAWPCGNCSGSMLGFDYHLELPTPLDLREGYLSIQGVGGANDCWFLWMCSATGVDNASLKNVGQGWTANTYEDDLNYCLGVGSAQPCDPVLTLGASWSEAGCQLSWEPVPGASSYQVYSSASPTAAFSLLGSTNQGSYLDSTAPGSPQRYYRVLSVCP